MRLLETCCLIVLPDLSMTIDDCCNFETVCLIEREKRFRSLLYPKRYIYCDSGEDRQIYAELLEQNQRGWG